MHQRTMQRRCSPPSSTRASSSRSCASSRRTSSCSRSRAACCSCTRTCGGPCMARSSSRRIRSSSRRSPGVPGDLRARDSSSRAATRRASTTPPPCCLQKERTSRPMTIRASTFATTSTPSTPACRRRVARRCGSPSSGTMRSGQSGSTDAGKGYASARAGSTRCDHRWIIAHLLWLALVLLALSVFLFIPVCAFVDGGVERLCLGAGNDEHVDLWTLDMARLAAAVTGLVLAAANWEAWKLARWRARRDRGESAGDVPPPLGPTRTWLAAGATTFVLGLAVMYVGAPALAKLATPTDPTGRTWTLLLFERAVHLGNGVSPLLPLLFPALAVHLWTLGQLVRIRLLRGHDVGTGERLFRRFAGADDPVLRETDKRLLELVRGRFSRRELIRTVLFAIPALAVLSYAWHFLHSPDGPKFDHLFAGLLATVVLITGHSLLRAWRLWSALRTALERLRLHEVGKALQRLPELLQQQRLRRLFLWAPQYADLQRSYEIFCKAFPPPMRAEAHRRIEGGLAKDRRVPLRARWDSPTLAALADAAEESRGGDPNCGQATSNFVASQLALTILWVLAHLRLRLVHLVLSAVAILCAVAFYPLQAHRALMLLIWIVVLGAAGIAVVIYVHHDRNEVLSWLNGTPVGRVTLDTEHVVHFVTLGAAPLLALLAFQFPAFGHWLAGWLGPLFGGAR